LGKGRGARWGWGQGGDDSVKGRRRVHLPRGDSAPEEGLDDDGSPLKKRGGPPAAPPRGIEPRPLAAKPPGVPSKR